ncbi:MAG: aconitate hydratase, partial [Bdellovibrionales bacterium]|nr:aconitate hydratase [Bdellovibrionales bacterium]
MTKDLFNCKRNLDFGSGSKANYFSLNALEHAGVGQISKLPYSIRILLESVLRNCDGFAFTEDHVKKLANWKAKEENREETPYKPARVVLQDFTGVPAVVDLAVMRDVTKKLGGDPQKINP